MYSVTASNSGKVDFCPSISYKLIDLSPDIPAQRIFTIFFITKMPTVLALKGVASLEI